MKKLNKALLALFGGLFTLAACSDATDMELKNPADLTRSNKSEAYYAKLREYKKSDHQKAFGWFGNWTGAGVSLENSLQGLPDSVDFVSLWGNWKNLTTAQKEDLKIVQQKKGTKVLMCFLVFDIGDQITPSIPEDKAAAGTTWKQWRHEFWGWGSDKASKLAAVEKYANAICDTIDKYNYDGFDIDAEPNYSHPFGTNYEMWRTDVENGVPTLMTLFIETLGKRIGPMAETEAGRKKILAVDGEPDALPASHAKYFNYFIIQAYNNSVGYNNGHFQGMLRAYKDVLSVEEICKKSIFVVDFESGATTGGKAGLGQILNFALQNPVVDGVTYRKGGVGAFRVDLEYAVTTPDVVNGIDMKPVKGLSYPWWRRAIQLMNPQIK